MGRRSSRALWTAKLAGKGLPSPASEPATRYGERFKGRILGIDPSLRGTGAALVEVDSTGRFHLILSEVLKIAPKYSQAHCLGEIGRLVSRLLRTHEIDHVSVEETIYVQNFRTAQIMGMARGAVLTMATVENTPVFEYPPLRIKQSVSGFGRASKEQVAKQVAALLNLAEPLGFDQSDAAATAICHALTWRGSPNQIGTTKKAAPKERP